MEYKAIYRLWRPTSFEEVFGQEAITKTIQNSIESNKVSHAYLFTGTRGTGKTSMAKLIAKALNCLKRVNANPCGQCSNCTSIDRGSMMDVLEIDAASNRGIDEIRDLKEKIIYSPTEGKYKVYIIDEAHMLTNEAFNALLKTLEEPPGHTVFILATTEPQKLPATIRSRCQRFDFKRIPTDVIKSRMEEILNKMNIRWEEEALRFIAQKGDGSFRDALSILDQCVSFGENILTLEKVHDVLGTAHWNDLLELTYDISMKNTIRVLQRVNNLLDSGKDEKQFLEGLLNHYRDLMIIKVGGGDELLDLPKEVSNEFRQLADRLTLESIIYSIDKINEGLRNLRYSTNPRIHLECIFITLTKEELDTSQGAILARLAHLENIIKSSKITSDITANGLDEFKPPEKTDATNKIIPIDERKENEKTVEGDGNIPLGDIDIKEIEQKWQEIINLCKKELPGMGSLLKYMEIVDVSNKIFSLAFKTATYRKLYEKGNYHEKLNEYINRVFNGDYKIKYSTKNIIKEISHHKLIDNNNENQKESLKEKVIRDFPGVTFEIVEGKNFE